MKKLFALFLALSALASASCATVLPGPRVPAPRPPRPVEAALPELKHDHTDKCAKLDTNKVHIVCILDRSGSMSHLTSDTIGGYNFYAEGYPERDGVLEHPRLIEQGEVTSDIFLDAIRITRKRLTLFRLR